MSKDKIVFNYCFCKVVIDFGFVCYIINIVYMIDKWWFVFVEDYFECIDNFFFDGLKIREMLIKIFVDVVEVLIGVFYISGGINKVFVCIFLFFFEVKW